MDAMIDPRPVPPAPQPASIPWERAMISNKPGRLARLLGARWREDRGYRMHWGEWTWRWGIWLDLCNWGEDQDWSFHIGLIYGAAFVKLPFLPTREPKDMMDQWGFSWDWADRGADVHLHWRERTKILHLPWSWGSCVRWEMLCPDGTWGKYVSLWKRKEGDPQPATAAYPYRYVCRDGRVQNVTATIEVHEMEWRWAIARLLHTPWPRRIDRSISVDFSAVGDDKDFDGIGERAGSYKGGTIGCGYSMRPGEMPEECLRRMQRDRKF